MGDDNKDNVISGLDVPEWQCDKKSIQESLEMLVDNALMSDITLIVGIDHDKTRFHAHKLILSSRSRVFYALFYGPLATREDEVEIPDVEPAAFLVLLKFIYSNISEIDSDTVVSVLNAAKKYEILMLESLCVDYLATNLTSDNVCTVLMQARYFDESRLLAECLKLIDLNAAEVLMSPGFLLTDNECLSLLLERDTLGITEAELYQACLRWAESHCMSRNLTVNSTNLRSVLGNSLNLIRFPLMTLVDFAKIPTENNPLTPDEIIAVFKFLCLNTEKPALPFLSSPRYFSLRRFKSKVQGTTLGGSFTFYVNRRVFLVGFYLFGPVTAENSTIYDVGISVTQRGVIVGQLPSRNFTCSGRMFQVNFDAPIELIQSQSYSVVVSVTGSASYCGTEPIPLPSNSAFYSMSNSAGNQVCYISHYLA